MFRLFALYSLACLLCGEAAAQAVHGGVCRPVSERDQEVGCWIFGTTPLESSPETRSSGTWIVSRHERPQKPRREDEAQSCKPLGKFGCSRSMMRLGTRPAGNISAQSVAPDNPRCLYRSIHGGGVYTRNDRPDAHSFRSGSLVHGCRRDMPRNT